MGVEPTGEARHPAHLFEDRALRLPRSSPPSGLLTLAPQRPVIQPLPWYNGTFQWHARDPARSRWLATRVASPILAGTGVFPCRSPTIPIGIGGKPLTKLLPQQLLLESVARPQPDTSTAPEETVTRTTQSSRFRSHWVEVRLDEAAAV